MRLRGDHPPAARVSTALFARERLSRPPGMPGKMEGGRAKMLCLEIWFEDIEAVAGIVFDQAATPRKNARMPPSL